MSTRINPTQMNLTGSNAAAESTLASHHVFVVQHGSGGDASVVKTVTADVMQAYFSKMDVSENATNGDQRIIFIANGSGDADDADPLMDSNSLTFNPSSDLLKIGNLNFTSDGAVVNFGADNEVTLTHVHNTGLLLSADDKLQFGDSGTFVHQSSDGVLTATADTTLDLNGGAIDIDGSAITVDATSGISLQAEAASDFTVGTGSLSLIADAATNGSITLRSDITGSATAIHIDADQGAGAILDMDAGVLDIDVAGAATIDASGVSIDSDAASNFTVSSGDLSLVADASNAQVVVKGDHESGVAIHLDGNAAAASIVDIDAGQLDIDASDWVKIDAADEIEVTTTSADGHITLHSAHTAGQAILIDANAAAGSILDVDAGILTVDTQGAATHTVGGAFLVDGASTVGIQGAGTISIGTADSGTAVNIGHGTSDVTIGDNLIVTGDFTVNGTNTVVNSTVTTMDDPLIVLGKDNPGVARDLGIIFEQSGSSSNLGFFYDRSASKFVLQQSLSEAGTTAGDITLGSYAALQVAALNATSGDFSGDMTAATITMTGFAVDADGDTALKSLAVDDGSTIGCDSDTDLLTLAAGALTAKGTVTVGVNDTGHDVKFFGATDGAYMLWDESADDLILAGAGGLVVPDGQLTLASTAVTSTAAELNVLDGYADAAFVAADDSIVFADANASTGGSDLRRESTSDFLTAIAGSGLEVASSQLKIVLSEQIFTSSSMSSGTAATLTVAASSQLSNSLAVYHNGMLQQVSSGGVTKDYSISGTTLTMASALHAEDVLIVRYQTA